MPFIIIPIIVIIVLLVLGYTKAPPNKAAVITGLRDKPKVLLGKAGFKIPSGNSRLFNSRDESV